MTAVLDWPLPSYRMPGATRCTSKKQVDEKIIDLIAIELACKGVEKAARGLRTPERDIAVQILTARGFSGEAVAKRLFLNERTVQRYRNPDHPFTHRRGR